MTYCFLHPYSGQIWVCVHTHTHSWYRGAQIPWREIFVGPQCGASCHLIHSRTV